MQAILKKLGLFLVGFAVLFAALHTISESVDPAPATVEVRAVRAEGDALEAIAIGNSHNMAVDFEALSVNGLHVWMNARDLFETRVYLESILPELPQLRYILMPMSFFLLERDNTALQSRDYSINRIEVYRMPTCWTFLEGESKLFLMGKISGVARPDHWQGVVAGLIGRNTISKNTRASLRSLTRKRHLLEQRADEPLDQLAENSAHWHMQSAAESRAMRPNILQDAVRTMEHILQLTQSRNIPLIVYTPPYPEAYLAAYDSASVQRMKTVMASLISTHEGAYYFDHSADSAFIHQPTYFIDEHMSNEGAHAFSNILRNRIDTIHQ